MATFIPDNYLKAEAALDQIAANAADASNRVDNAVKTLVSSTLTLERMFLNAPNGWADAAQYIDNQAAANPNDTQWQAIKGRKDKIQADAIAMRNRAQAIRDAAQAEQ